MRRRRGNTEAASSLSEIKTRARRYSYETLVAVTKHLMFLKWPNTTEIYALYMKIMPLANSEPGIDISLYEIIQQEIVISITKYGIAGKSFMQL